MRVVVTGAAGFVGSHVAQALLEVGHEVLAVDSPDRSSAPEVAHNLWAWLAQLPGLTPIEVDLAVDDLAKLAEADVVVHLAGRPGVRTSWGAGRAAVERDNVTATRRLLGACTGKGPRVVVASSSSVYGSAGWGRSHHEGDPLRPASPYAISKVEVERLAAEAARAGLSTVILRYFSVYGPRQRPDMAFHRFIEAALDGRPLRVFGDGRQSRSFTHVRDVVAATLTAAVAELPPGIAINIGHPEPVEVRSVIGLLAKALDIEPEIHAEAPVAGDVTRTWADTTRAERLLGWSAATGPADGLADQIAWHQSLRSGWIRHGISGVG